MVVAALLRAGKVVLMPFGNNQRYDMVIDEGGKFSRVQCKTGRLKKDVIIFATRSVAGGKSKYARSYIGQIEFFGIYCPENGKCYLVPIDICGKNQARLHLSLSNSQRKARIAEHYEIG